MPIRRCTTAMRATTRFAAVRARRHGPLPGALRRPHRPRALRRARPGPRLLPDDSPGRAPRKRSRTRMAALADAGALRGGRLGARPAPRAGRRAAASPTGRLARRRRPLVVHLGRAGSCCGSTHGALTRGGGAPRPTRSASPAPASAPTSWPPSVRGWRGTPCVSAPPTWRRASPSTAAPPSRGSARRCATPTFRRWPGPDAPRRRGLRRPAARLAAWNERSSSRAHARPIGKFLGSFAETAAVELGTPPRSKPSVAPTSSPTEIDQTIMATRGRPGTGRTPAARSASAPASRRRSAPTTSTSPAAPA